MRRADGHWRVFEPRELFRAQKLATTVYRSEMARSLHRLGHGVEVRRDGSVGITGFSHEDLDVFSQRRADMLMCARGAGTITDRLGKKAAEASRPSAKMSTATCALAAAWRERACEQGTAAPIAAFQWRFDMQIPQGPARNALFAFFGATVPAVIFDLPWDVHIRVPRELPASRRGSCSPTRPERPFDPSRRHGLHKLLIAL